MSTSTLLYVYRLFGVDVTGALDTPPSPRECSWASVADDSLHWPLRALHLTDGGSLTLQRRPWPELLEGYATPPEVARSKWPANVGVQQVSYLCLGRTSCRVQFIFQSSLWDQAKAQWRKEKESKQSCWLFLFPCLPGVGAAGRKAARQWTLPTLPFQFPR